MPLYLTPLSGSHSYSPSPTSNLKGKKQSGSVAMEGGGEGFPEKEKENIFVSISRKIGEAYAWLKDKLISLFKLFSESITKVFLGLKSFVTSCCEKLREVLSGINAQLDNQFGKKMVVVPEEEEEEEASLQGDMKMGVVLEEKASLLVEMKMLVQKMRSSANQCLGIRNSLEMKTAYLRLNGFLDLSEEFLTWLKYANGKPLFLILRIVDVKTAGHNGEAAMAMGNLMSYFTSKCPLLD